jgi:hypothetical protein
LRYLRSLIGDFSTIGAITGLVASAISAWALLTGVIGTEPNAGNSQQTLEQRIALLTTNLDQASSAISDIEREIDERRQIVSRLEEQRQIAEAITTLNKEQVEAVAQLFKGEVEASNRRSFWRDIWVTVAVSAFFYILGAVTPATYGWLTTRLRKPAH